MRDGERVGETADRSRGGETKREERREKIKKVLPVGIGNLERRSRFDDGACQRQQVGTSRQPLGGGARGGGGTRAREGARRAGELPARIVRGGGARRTRECATSGRVVARPRARRLDLGGNGAERRVPKVVTMKQKLARAAREVADLRKGTLRDAPVRATAPAERSVGSRIRDGTRGRSTTRSPASGGGASASVAVAGICAFRAERARSGGNVRTGRARKTPSRGGREGRATRETRRTLAPGPAASTTRARSCVPSPSRRRERRLGRRRDARRSSTHGGSRWGRARPAARRRPGRPPGATRSGDR